MLAFKQRGQQCTSMALPNTQHVILSSSIEYHSVSNSRCSPKQSYHIGYEKEIKKKKISIGICLWSSGKECYEKKKKGRYDDLEKHGNTG